MIAGYFWLNDRQWEKVAPLLPPYLRGKRRVDDRRVISGIIRVILSGCRWSDAPPEYGPRKTYNRFMRRADIAPAATLSWRCPPVRQMNLGRP